MKRRQIIIAGREIEAFQCAEIAGLKAISDFAFVNKPDQLRGVSRESVIWLCGTYESLPEWSKIMEMIQSRNLKTLRM